MSLMPEYEELQNRKNQLIRKALGGGLYLAPLSVAAVETLTGPDGSLIEFVTNDETGYTDGGWMTDDGMQMSRDTDSSDITSFGAVEPTRSDVTSDVQNVEVAFQETNRLTISMFTGVDIDKLIPDPKTGELQVTKPTRPKSKYWRLLALAVDDSEYGEVYVAASMPRAKTNEFSDQAFAKGDNAIEWGATFQAQSDSTLGYSLRYLFGGPGWKGLLADMGWSESGS